MHAPPLRERGAHGHVERRRSSDPGTSRRFARRRQRQPTRFEEVRQQGQQPQLLLLA
jgi:hypothetical protein